MSEAASELESGAQPASDYEVAVIGAGQAGLAMGYYLARKGDGSSSSSAAIRSRPRGVSAGTR